MLVLSEKQLQKYRDAAQLIYQRDGEVEIDYLDKCVVSYDETAKIEEGAYVAAWVWVSRGDVIERSHQCSNCSLYLERIELNEIRDYWDRVGEDCPVPSGECPACGALCYPVEDE